MAVLEKLQDCVEGATSIPRYKKWPPTHSHTSVDRTGGGVSTDSLPDAMKTLMKV